MHSVMKLRPLIMIRLRTFHLMNVPHYYPPLGSHMSDDDPVIISKEKESLMRGVDKSPYPQDAPGWNEELASVSEAIVKAERAHTDSNLDELQQESIHYLKSRERTDEQSEISQMAIESDLVMEEYFELERNGVCHEPEDEDRQETILGEKSY